MKVATEPRSLTRAQAAERQKYIEIFSRPTDTGKTPYGSGNHASHALEHIAELNLQSVADVGCGNGEFCAWLSQSLKLERVVAIDWAARPTLPPDVELIEAPAWELPLADGSVDYVTAFDVLEHLLPDDVEATLVELRRVARRGMIFSIAYRDSFFRAADGSTLHPTVRPKEWWCDAIREHTGCSIEEWPEGPTGYLHCT